MGLASRQQDFRELPEQPAGPASIHPLSHCSLLRTVRTGVLLLLVTGWGISAGWRLAMVSWALPQHCWAVIVQSRGGAEILVSAVGATLLPMPSVTYNRQLQEDGKENPWKNQ